MDDEPRPGAETQPRTKFSWGIALAVLGLFVALLPQFIRIEPVATLKAAWWETAFHCYAPTLSWILASMASFWLGWLVSPRRRRFPGIAEAVARANKNDELRDRSAASTTTLGLCKSKKLELLRSLKEQLNGLDLADHGGFGRLKTRAEMIAKQVFGDSRVGDLNRSGFYIPRSAFSGDGDDVQDSRERITNMNALLDTWIEEVELTHNTPETA